MVTMLATRPTAPIQVNESVMVHPFGISFSQDGSRIDGRQGFFHVFGKDLKFQTGACAPVGLKRIFGSIGLNLTEMDMD